MADEFTITPQNIEPNFIPIGLQITKQKSGFGIDDTPAPNENPITESDSDDNATEGATSGVDLKEDNSNVIKNINVLNILKFKAAEAISAGNAVATQVSAMDFELGSSQHLSIADNAGLSITGDMTIEAWVKFETDIAATEQDIVTKNVTSGDQRAYRFVVDNDSLFLAISSLGTAASTNGSTVSWNPNPATGKWYHVAVTYEASSREVKFYVDGIQQGATQINGQSSIFDSSAAFNIGGATNFFDGKIDDVRIWTVVRTPEEISNNYKTELLGTETGLEGYWKLNDSLLDETSNDHDLTNNNSAVFVADSGMDDGDRIIKANASAAKTANFIGFADEDILVDRVGKVKVIGIADQITSVSISRGIPYFLSNTAGEISEVTGTVTVRVGRGIDAGKLLITNIWT